MPKKQAVGTVQIHFKDQKTLCKLNGGWGHKDEMNHVEVEQMKGYYSVHHTTIKHELKEQKEGMIRTRNPVPTCKSIRLMTN